MNIVIVARELAQIGARSPAVLATALEFIRGLLTAGKINAESLGTIASNADAMRALGAHPRLSVADLLRVVRWLRHIADHHPTELATFLAQIRNDLGE